MGRHKTRLAWRLWLVWVLANAVGGLAGEGASAGLFGLASLLGSNSQSWIPSGFAYFAANLSFMIHAAIIWLFLGSAQWLALWPYLEGVRMRSGVWWVLSSAVASIVGVYVGKSVTIYVLIFSSLLLPGVATPADGPLPLLANLVEGVAIGLVPGALVGTAQWLVLRRQEGEPVVLADAPRRGPHIQAVWIVANTIGWALGLGALAALSGSVLSVIAVLESVLAGALVIVTAAAITGLALPWALPSTVRHNQLNPKLVVPTAVAALGAIALALYLSNAPTPTLPSQAAGADVFGKIAGLQGATWSPDGRWPAIDVYQTMQMQIWDVSARQVITQVGNFNRGAGAPMWSQDGRYVAVGPGMAASPVQVLDSRNWHVVQSFTPSEFIQAMAWSPDGKNMAVGMMSRGVDVTGFAQVWDIATGQSTLTITSTQPVESAAWSPDGRLLAFGTYTKQDDPSDPRGLTAFFDDVVLILRMEHGAESTSTGPDERAAAPGPIVERLTGPRGSHDGQAAALAWSPDGRWLAVGTGGGLLKIWDIAGRRLHSRLEGAGGSMQRAVPPSITGVAWSPDSRLIATTSMDNLLRIWDVSAGREIAALKHPDIAQSVAWSPDGKQVSTACPDDRLRLWDATKWKVVR